MQEYRYEVERDRIKVIADKIQNYRTDLRNSAKEE